MSYRLSVKLSNDTAPIKVAIEVPLLASPLPVLLDSARLDIEQPGSLSVSSKTREQLPPLRFPMLHGVSFITAFSKLVPAPGHITHQ